MLPLPVTKELEYARNQPPGVVGSDAPRLGKCAATRHGTCDGRTDRLMMAQGTKLRLRRRRDLTGHDSR